MKERVKQRTKENDYLSAPISPSLPEVLVHSTQRYGAIV